jgi:putative transposase
MQQIITAKLKLMTTPEQFQTLRQTQLAYRDDLNAVSHYAFEQGKTSNVTRLHKGTYAQLRARYHLPSQLACSVERQVASTYKGLWTKLLKNKEHRRKKITKKRFKGLDQPPRYSSPTVQYTYERDYTFSETSRSVSARSTGVSLPRIRAMTSISRAFGMGQASVMPNSGTINQRSVSICSFP